MLITAALTFKANFAIHSLTELGLVGGSAELREVRTLLLAPSPATECGY